MKTDARDVLESPATVLRDIKTFNRMVAERPELADRLIRGEHDFLQWQQTWLYSAFRAYRARPVAALRTATAPPAMTPGLFVSGLAACFLTACAVFFRQADVLLFSVDKTSSKDERDFRIEGLYRFLQERRFAYVEAFHTMLGRAFYRNAWKRKRSAIYHEAFDFLAGLRSARAASEARRVAASLPCEGFGEADRPYVRALAEAMLRKASASLITIRWYRRALARLRPRAILAIDDVRYYHELLAAAKELGIPSYAFQHGHFTKYHVGWLKACAGARDSGHPDAFFVWSPYWKKELLRLGSAFKESAIRVGGNPKGDAPPPDAGAYTPPSEDGRLEILVPFETDGPHLEIADALRALVKTGRIKIWLKTRPDRDAAEQLRTYGFDAADPSRVEAVPDAAAVLGRVHAVLGVFTSYLYDAVALRKPVFVLKTSHDGGEGMILNGLADPFDAEGPDAAGRLAEACREAAPKLEARAETYLRGAGMLTETLEAILPQA